jgi:ABC-type multidrug transport system fused ATPase/permease subunit
MNRYLSHRWMFVCILLAIIAGFMVPFNTWSYSEIFALIGGRNRSVVWPKIGLIIVGTILFSVIDYGYTRAINHNVAIFNQKVREHLLTSDFIQADQAGVSERLSYLTNDLGLIENNDIRQIFSIIRAVVTVIFTLLLALHNNLSLTLIFIVFASLTPFTSRLFAKQTQQHSQQWSRRVGEYMTFMSDLVKNADTVCHYNALRFFLRKGHQIIVHSVAAKQQRDNIVAKSNLFSEVVAYICLYVPIGYGIMMVLNGQLTLSSFVAVQYASNWIVNTFLSITRSRNLINSTKPMINRLAEFTPFDHQWLNSNSTSSVRHGFTKLQLTHINFAYLDSQSQTVLADVNLVVHRGEKVLITGASGAGKTTLINILMGALHPTNGQINIETSSEKVCVPTPEMFGHVRQEASIFNDTLRFNLTLGGDFSDAQIHTALKKAGLAAYAATHGLDNRIAENGNNLSGGEQKRIELARAFLYNRQFLIVDEGTASLDPKTADDIQEILLQSPLTVIEVDHHISTEMSRRFDQHATLKQGILENDTF